MFWRYPTVSRSAVLAVALACAGAQAAPEASPDPVAKLLQDKGLATPPQAHPALEAGKPAAAAPTLNANDPSFVQQMRDSASEMVLTAMNFLGVRYRRGGNNAEDGFDCSGFTRYVFENSLGLILPRRADEQASAPGLLKIKRDDLQPGDLVFFNTLKRTFSHVGIYVGEGKFIHAPRTGSHVRVEDMRFSYWAKRFSGARRPAATSIADLPRNTPQTATAAQTAPPITPPAVSAVVNRLANLYGDPNLPP